MIGLVLLVLAVAGVLLVALIHHPRQETPMTTGLHDHPGIYPPLPAREIDHVLLDPIPENDVFRAAWEFRLSHQLTDAEGSAFWHGVNVQHRADQERLADLEELHGSTVIDLADMRDRAEHAEAQLARVRAELEPPVDAVRRLHSQDDTLLAPGRWCPACGQETPCPTIRALNGETGR